MRFAAMLRAGLLDEVRRLYERGDLTPQHSSMRSVGYRQLWRHCANELTLEQASSAAVTATAQLAKRQLTWLRRDRELIVLPNASVADLEQVIAAIVGAASA
jgi:tRNA dimethylallyltransferase